ncbi:porin [Loktanella sp. M215]|nr:porin [Loktanella sp. M215]
MYAKFAGLRVDVGNVGTAFDNAALMYNSEVGYIGNSDGDPLGSFYAFASGPYGADQRNRMGVAVSYAFGAGNVRASIVNPNQQLDGLPGGQDIEYGISGDYGFGAFTVSAAYVTNGAGITDNDNYYVGAEYAINDAGTVGLQYFDDGDETYNVAGDNGEHYTLYGSYVFGQITAKAYVAQRQGGAGDDTAYGIGADYDLGGALLAVSVREDYDSNTLADFGVKFNF